MVLGKLMVITSAQPRSFNCISTAASRNCRNDVETLSASKASSARSA